MNSKQHPCKIAPGAFDHDWEWINDWYGDPSVVNGTADCSHYRCRACGEEDYESEPPTFEPDDGYGLL